MSSTVRSTLIGQVGNNGLSVLICEELHCAAEDTTMPWEASMKGVRHSAVAVPPNFETVQVNCFDCVELKAVEAVLFIVS